MMGLRLRQLAAATACCFVTLTQAQAQQLLNIEPVRPSGPFVVRPYKEADVPPVRLGNSGRFANLIRAGKLYLTAQDAIAHALENNIDIEVSRYNLPTLEWRLERAQAGGALPGVPSASSQASGVTSGQGVLGSQQAVGAVGGNNGIQRQTSNATIAQIGPVTQTLDATFQESSAFAHRSLPQANATQSVTNVIVQNTRAHSATIQQGFVSGGSVTVSYSGRYLNENAPSNILNPSEAVSLAISAQHNLLQGRGIRLGSRNITIAKMNLAMSDNTFRAQLTRTVAQVLNAYYGLVGDFMDVEAKRSTLDAATRFVNETSRRLELGAVATLDVTTARNQSAQARLALSNSTATLEQRQITLKNLISRNGLADPALQGVTIIPLDSISIPPTDDLPPVPELLTKAYQNRTDLLARADSLKQTEESNLGTANGVLPSLQVLATRSSAGLGGTPRVVRGTTADPYFKGGLGVSVGQVLRQNFPTESAGIFGRVTINNRQALADQSIDELNFRQQQLNAARSKNQVAVDVTNAVVAIQQARARYEAAEANRKLQEQLYSAEEKRLAAGESTTYTVTQISRDVDVARSSELAALVAYRNARTNLEQNTGTILEDNKISLAEAKDGQVGHASSLPATLPQ
ncbi:MAG: TolC family protein [Bryobacterales bacterium]|nr:TolC family protein [Bryobacterales bacterium]